MCQVDPRLISQVLVAPHLNTQTYISHSKFLNNTFKKIIKFFDAAEKKTRQRGVTFLTPQWCWLVLKIAILVTKI